MKPRAYSSLMGQPVYVEPLTSYPDTLAIPRFLIGQKDVEDDLRAQKDDLEFVINQGRGLEVGGAPFLLDPSLISYK
ncbi:hypothetical protein Tco_0352850 [Tanacetum coccineum]